MTRLQAVLAGMCSLVIALGPSLAHADGATVAQNYPPPEYQQPPPGYQQPPPGYQQPPPGYQQPPPGYQQPPPGYYQQPPPGYPPVYQAVPPQPVYAMPVYQRPPRSGIAEIVTGFILLPIGIIFIGASVVLWNDACSNFRSTCLSFPGSTDYDNAIGAVWLDVIGAAFTIAGIILIPVGFARHARYNDWKRRHGWALGNTGLALEPVFGPAANVSASHAPSLSSGTLGLKLTF